MKDISNNLEGRKLANGWIIKNKIKLKNTSGGNFSVSYSVERISHGNTEHAFLKALNLARAFRTSNFMKELEKLTATHNFERELLEICASEKMSKIIRILDYGDVQYVDDGIEEEFYPVPYLIFEAADGSVRDKLNNLKVYEPLWILKSLHSITTGLNQLHSKGIAHQDLKPSNVLIFDKKDESKLGDLGRSDMKGRSAPHSVYSIAGDPSYAPPELLYNHVHPDWSYRRVSCDLYHLGSMIFFYFTHTHATDHIRINLPPQFHWNNWSGEYDQVLPYLIDALELSLDELKRELVNYYSEEAIVSELLECTRQLCNPEINKRGHPVNRQRKGNTLSLERYITIFDRTAKKYGLLRLRK
jgi:serine/threonine protein kinase